MNRGLLGLGGDGGEAVSSRYFDLLYSMLEREQFIDIKQKLSINWANEETVSQREPPQVTPSPELNSQNSGRTSASRVGDHR